MNCAELQPLFDADPRPSDFAQAVDQLRPECCCERHSVSSMSKGNPVEDDEPLVRIVLTPKDVRDSTSPHIEDTAMLPVIGSGLSVFRENNPSEIRDAAISLANKSAQNIPFGDRVEVWGVIRFTAGDLRARRLEDGKRAYCVYETPEPETPSHADVLLTASNFNSNNRRKKAAFNLLREYERNGWAIPASEYGYANLVGISVDGMGPRPA